MSQMSFWNRAAADPGKIAVIDAAGTTLTYGQLLAESNRLTAGLREVANVREGATVACVTANGLPMVALFLAAMQSGFYLVTINYHSSAEEIRYILDDCDAQIVIASQRCAAAAQEAVAASRRLSAGQLYVAGDDLHSGSFGQLTRGSAEPPERRPAGSVMQYTSGTTGHPKGVKRPLPAGGADAAARMYEWFFVDECGFSAADDGVWLVAAPMYHLANINMASAALHLGQTLVLMDGWTPELFLDLVARHAVSVTHLVPTQFVRLLRCPDRDRYDVSSLTSVLHGAAPCPPAIKRQMFSWLGPVLYEYYGSTEVSSTIARPQEWLDHPGTVGRPASVTELAVLDGDGVPVPAGTVGTVYMKMGGERFEYHNDPGKSAAARRGSLVTVGDLGYVDDDGFLYLVGREIDMIISGGVNIYPAEVEAALLEFPEIGDVAVTGRPDDDLGEVAVAWAQPAQGVAAGPDLHARIMDFARGRLGAQKVPASLVIVDQLPRDPNGKLYKSRLGQPEYG